MEKDTKHFFGVQVGVDNTVFAILDDPGREGLGRASVMGLECNIFHEGEDAASNQVLNTLLTLDETLNPDGHPVRDLVSRIFQLGFVLGIQKHGDLKKAEREFWKACGLLDD